MPSKSSLNLLKKLTETPGVSGFEEKVRKVLEREFKKYCDPVSVDKVGNLIGRKGRGKKKLMVVCHMDEVGMVVSNIDADGLLHFVKIGFISDVILLAQDIFIWGKKGPVPGIIGVNEEQELGKNIKAANMFIDVGAKSRMEVEKMGIEIESQVTFTTASHVVGKSFIGKALDNRVGCYVLVEVMKKVKPNCTVYFVANAVEEVGLKGAQVSTFKIDPDAAIVVDVSNAEDFPAGHETHIRLGGGPVLVLVEAGGEGLITDMRIKELFMRTAKKLGIKVQLEVSSHDAVSEGTTIQLTREGVPTGAINIPIRYPHSVSSIANIDDINDTVKLLCDIIKNFKV